MAYCKLEICKRIGSGSGSTLETIAVLSITGEIKIIQKIIDKLLELPAVQNSVANDQELELHELTVWKDHRG